MPMGRVSASVYNSIFSARSFDRYGKMVPNKMTDKERMIADLQATLTAQTNDANEASAGAAAEKKGKAVEELEFTKQQGVLILTH